MERVEDMLHKMMRRFDASDEHIKELRSGLAGIGKKVGTHAILLRRLSCKWPNYLRQSTHGNWALFLAALSKIQKMMRTV